MHLFASANSAPQLFRNTWIIIESLYIAILILALPCYRTKVSIQCLYVG